jgi:predicted outer membrane repeat protein
MMGRIRSYHVSLIPVLALLFVVALCDAAVIHVPGDQPTIQAGINAAGPGDTVLVASGMYSPSTNGESFPIVMVSGVTVISVSGPASTVVDAAGTDRVFQCQNVDATASIAGFTITGGVTAPAGYPANCGAGVQCLSSSPGLAGCVFSDNVAALHGGAIFCMEGSSPSITDCAFTDNIAVEYVGGAIKCVNQCSLTLTRCSFSGNSAFHDGGAIACFVESELFLTDCSFLGNSCGRQGGGVYCGHGCSAELTGCLFAGNSARDAGGLYLISGDATMTACRFLDNSAELDGGGVNINNECTLSLDACEFANNDASRGGGVCCEGFSSSLTCIHSTFAGNSASTDGGGLCLSGYSTAIVDNTIIAFGLAGEALHCDAYSWALLSCCDVYENAGGDWVGCIFGQNGTYGNISECPLFCDIDNNDYHLQVCSPCVEGYGCGQIGAYGVGCDCGEPSLAHETTWGQVKAQYR